MLHYRTGITITALFLMQARNNLNKGIFEYHVPYHGIPHNQRNELELSYFFRRVAVMYVLNVKTEIRELCINELFFGNNDTFLQNDSFKYRCLD